MEASSSMIELRIEYNRFLPKDLFIFKIVNSFEKHQRKITGLEFIPRNIVGANHALCLTSSEDGLGYVLNNNLETGEITAPYKVDAHKDTLIGCTVHPLSSIGIFTARNGFSFHDLQQVLAYLKNFIK